MEKLTYSDVTYQRTLPDLSADDEAALEALRPAITARMKAVEEAMFRAMTGALPPLPAEAPHPIKYEPLVGHEVGRRFERPIFLMGLGSVISTCGT